MLNFLISRFIGYVPKPIVKKVSTRYIAGAKLDDAIRVIRALNGSNALATVDVLGEFVNTTEQVTLSMAHDIEVLDTFFREHVLSNLSIKLTSLGLNIDYELCCRNVKKILECATQYNNFVRMDMEDSSCTRKTLDVYKRMRSEGFTNTGVVLQAYMRRSAADIDALPRENLNVRLCKGIYIEPESIAYKGYEEVRNNYKLLLRKLIDTGAYVGIATHDEALIQDAYALINERNLPKTAYEFQMLLGVREERRSQIIRDGHRMRVYVPFGDDWYGYSTRRLKENPQIAMNVVKSLFGIS